MTGDVHIRVEGRAGRITLARPGALNALSYAMCVAVDRALREWQDDEAVALVILDAEGARAFCAGGDIAEMYHATRAGDLEFGRRFWRDEYRMNARIAEYAKPVVSFLQGVTMGGGVGLGCHGSHRIVGESSRIAMPECGIGLVPDVGGSLLLARAPGQLGRYLGLTGTRMEAGDAIAAGFADLEILEDRWPALKAALARDGDTGILADAAQPAEAGQIAQRALIDRLFAGASVARIMAALARSDTPLAAEALERMRRNCPLSLACALEMHGRLQGASGIREALRLEYRFTHRAAESGDFIEGIRAAIIDKDRNPRWSHAPGRVAQADIDRMLAPLGAEELDL